MKVVSWGPWEQDFKRHGQINCVEYCYGVTKTETELPTGIAL